MINEEPKWAEYITEESIENPDLKLIMSVIGFEATKKLMIHLPGMPIQIPKAVLSKYKTQYIIDNYNGTKYSRMKLVTECNITESYLYKIIEKNKKNKKS